MIRCKRCKEWIYGPGMKYHPWCAAILNAEQDLTGDQKPDLVNHPSHYNAHPSGIEAIQVTEHMNFCIGNAMKYLWRADSKDNPIQDLEKAKWYIEREIERRKR